MTKGFKDAAQANEEEKGVRNRTKTGANRETMGGRGGQKKARGSDTIGVMSVQEKHVQR